MQGLALGFVLLRVESLAEEGKVSSAVGVCSQRAAKRACVRLHHPTFQMPGKQVDLATYGPAALIAACSFHPPQPAMLPCLPHAPQLTCRSKQARPSPCQHGTQFFSVLDDVHLVLSHENLRTTLPMTRYCV